MQIDANFGGTAGIAEMLLQSRSRYRNGKAEYEIELLPALPESWYGRLRLGPSRQRGIRSRHDLGGRKLNRRRDPFPLRNALYAAL